MDRRHPRKLIRHLQEVRGYTVEETARGVYTVSGDILPIQIVDSRKLSADENMWLKSLGNRLNFLEIKRLSEEVVRQKKGAQIAAYLYVIAKANARTIQEAIEMSDALTIEQVFENVGWTAKWEARGHAQGIAENTLEIARKMKDMGDSVERIHAITGLSPEAIEKL